MAHIGIFPNIPDQMKETRVDQGTDDILACSRRLEEETRQGLPGSYC